MRLTPDDFVGKIASLGRSDVRERLQELIDIEVPIFLQKLYGSEVATKIMEGDVEYAEIANETYKAPSPAVDYIFVSWLRMTSSENGQTGEYTADADTVTETTSFHKQVQTWNNMVYKVDKLLTIASKSGLLRCHPDNDLVTKVNIYGI